MIKRICPICDQVMGSAHYCKVCRCRVKNPWVRDVTYYLNERHPVQESQCSYHSDVQGNAADDAVWKQRAMQGRGASSAQTLPAERNAKARQGKADVSGMAKKAMTGKNKNSTLGLIIILVIFAINLLGSCATMAVRTINHVVSEITDSGYDVDSGAFTDEMGEASWSVSGSMKEEKPEMQNGLILAQGMCYDNGYSVLISKTD